MSAKCFSRCEVRAAFPCPVSFAQRGHLIEFHSGSILWTNARCVIHTSRVAKAVRLLAH